MPKDQFDFKQFSIHQDRCSMKVGTDGVLIGAWAEKEVEGVQRVESVERVDRLQILDIGAGTGLISLMLAQRFPAAHITAIEIDADAAAQCLENFKNSPWAERLSIIPQSLQEAAQELSQELRFDCIVSNPPFYNATLKPEDEGRAIARHKDALPMDEIARFAEHKLSSSGSLSLIYPTDYDSEVMTACILHGLQPSRLCDVVTKEGKISKRRMATFVRQGSTPALITRENIAIRNESGDYTEAYLRLVEPFYLHLK